MRDSSRGDNIKAMLHKETASICEDHFLGTDILRHGKKSFLRLGAVPCRKIPRSSAVYQEKTRPLPAVREPLPEKIRYRSTRSLVSATSYLSQSMKDKLGKLELCCGIDRRDGSTLVHPVLSWGGDKINIKNIYRSTSCSTIVDVSIGCPMCSSCMSEQFKNDEEEHHPSQVMLQVDDTVHDMIKATFASESSILNTWQQIFFPLHVGTIQINVIPPQSGINKLALKEMERVIKDKGSLIGFVALDEMKGIKIFTLRSLSYMYLEVLSMLLISSNRLRCGLA
uniref:uncharacterized protein LOC120339933 n=1 Tax=Styela clava TaxID=7725 RepID=UPI001939F74F|nr:uncharacterized protein LOC120339933 [Styela clava]